jgi:hypothetical protein
MFYSGKSNNHDRKDNIIELRQKKKEKANKQPVCLIHPEFSRMKIITDFPTRTAVQKKSLIRKKTSNGNG